MAATPAETIVNHMRSIMSSGDWDFHGGGIEAIVKRNIERAVIDDRDNHLAAAIQHRQKSHPKSPAKPRKKKGQS